MRIAQVAPLTESVPPQLYGGTERVVAFLADELVRLGHDVTLFASGDSRTAARLVPVWPRALRLAGAFDSLAPHLLMLEQVARQEGWDIMRFVTLGRRLKIGAAVIAAGAAAAGSNAVRGRRQ